MLYSDCKAGLDGVDKTRIQKMIEQNTSANYEQFVRKRKNRIQSKTDYHRQILCSVGPEEIAAAQFEMDAYVEGLEKERDLSRICVHVDMDAFYAAVEMRDDPTLRSIPMAVGSLSMLSTSNYVARQSGVRSAMPGYMAKKICPDLKIIGCNFKKYTSASKEVRRILEEYDKSYRMASLDEAYLDITSYVASRTDSVKHVWLRYSGDCLCRLPRLSEEEDSNCNEAEFREHICAKCDKKEIIVSDYITFGVDPCEVVGEMRFKVEQATGLTCSAGIAPNSMIAKVCSNVNKPNGQTIVAAEKDQILSFMHALPIRRVSGIGPVTEEILKRIGIFNCGDLYDKRGTLKILLSEHGCGELLRIALGISHSYTLEEHQPRKSLSQERTFQPTSNLSHLLEILESLCNEVIDSLSDCGLAGGRSATLKIKFSSFDVITRCCSVNCMINSSAHLYSICEKLMKAELSKDERSVRLIGVRLSRLIFNGEQIAVSKSLEYFWNSEGKKSYPAGEIDDKSNSNLAITGGSENTLQDSDYASSGSSSSNVLCPVCRKTISNDLIRINNHLDECLNRKAVEEIIDCSGDSIDDVVVLSGETQICDNLTDVRRTCTPNASKKQRIISDYFPATIRDDVKRNK